MSSSLTTSDLVDLQTTANSGTFFGPKTFPESVDLDSCPDSDSCGVSCLFPIQNPHSFIETALGRLKMADGLQILRIEASSQLSKIEKVLNQIRILLGISSKVFNAQRPLSLQQPFAIFSKLNIAQRTLRLMFMAVGYLHSLRFRSEM